MAVTERETPETQISVWPPTTQVISGKKRILSKIKKDHCEVPGAGAKPAWVRSPALPHTS